MKAVVYYYNNVPVEKIDLPDEKVEVLRIGQVIRQRKKAWAIVDIRRKE